MEIKYPGVYEKLPIEVYHAQSPLGSTGVKQMHNGTIAHYKYGEFKSKPHFDIGTAIHVILLEPENFEKNVLVVENRKTKEYKELKDKKTGSQVIVTRSEYDKIIRLREKVFSKTENNKILLSDFGVSEKSAFVRCPKTNIKLKCRPDRVIEGEFSDILIDVKSCQSASYDKVVYDIAKYGYHIQEAFYRHVWQLATGKEISRFLFLFVEKEPPFASCIYEIEDSFVNEGRACMERVLDLYQMAELDGVYNDFPDEIVKATFPPYQYKLTDPPEEQTLVLNQPLNLEEI